MKTFASAMPFVPEAERQGLAADDAEVGRRLEVYRKLYPSDRIEMRMVRAILLAEKYLDMQGIAAGKEVATIHPEELKKLGFRGEAELEISSRALRSRALFDREDIRSGGKSLLNAEQLRKQLSRPAPKEAWSTGELQIPDAPEECVAQLDAACYVTVEEFNAAAGQMEFLREMPLDSARMAILKRYALAKKAAERREPGEPVWNERELLRNYKSIREGSWWRKAARAFGIPVMDGDILQATYQKHYRRHFRAREEATLSLIGSSDSGYVDSLHSLLASWKRGEAATRDSARLPAAPEPVLPWMDVKEEELPLELVAPTDTFRVGDFTGPIRTPYGFFIVRLTRLHYVKEIPITEAQGALIFLATRDRFLELDSLPEVMARQYYDRNLQEFSLPDTLELRAWLAPSAAGRAAPGTLSSPLPPDTLRFRALRLTSLALPAPVRLELQQAARKQPGKTYFGPFDGQFGRWHFQVKRRRPADGHLPYSMAREAIHKKLSALPKLPGETLTSDAAKNKVMLNLALARNRMLHRENKLREQVAGVFAERMRSGAFDADRFVDAKERGRAERLALIEMEEEIRARRDEDDGAFLDRIQIVSRGFADGRTNQPW